MIKEETEADIHRGYVNIRFFMGVEKNVRFGAHVFMIRDIIQGKILTFVFLEGEENHAGISDGGMEMMSLRKMECDRASAPYPEIHTSKAGGVEVICNACDLYIKLLKYGRYYETFPEEERTEKWVLADADGKPFLPNADSVLVSESVVPANPLPKETKKSIDRMMEILSKKLSSKEKEKMLPIVEYLMTHDEIEPHMARKLTGKSRTTVFRYMQRLKELDVIEEKGDSVSTVYKRK